jgi:predicted AAA+ superfamily ATPase
MTDCEHTSRNQKSAELPEAEALPLRENMQHFQPHRGGICRQEIPLQLRRRLEPPGKSFLHRGPRGTGKSTWLAESLPQALTIDLLDSSRFLELSSDPTALARLVAPLR